MPPSPNAAVAVRLVLNFDPTGVTSELADATVVSIRPKVHPKRTAARSKRGERFGNNDILVTVLVEIDKAAIAGNVLASAGVSAVCHNRIEEVCRAHDLAGVKDRKIVDNFRLGMGKAVLRRAKKRGERKSEKGKGDKCFHDG